MSSCPGARSERCQLRFRLFDLTLHTRDLGLKVAFVQLRNDIAFFYVHTAA